MILGTPYVAVLLASEPHPPLADVAWGYMTEEDQSEVIDVLYHRFGLVTDDGEELTQDGGEIADGLHELFARGAEVVWRGPLRAMNRVRCKK